MSSKEPLIYEITKSQFDTSVLLNSHKIPVVVEFLGVWSEHCMLLESRISKLAREFPGEFFFAKVDVDEQTELREQYQIKNMPTVKVFKDGEVVLTEEGVMEEAELRTMLKSFGIFRESDEMRETARQQHIAGNTPAAINLLAQAAKNDPSNVRVAMDMVQIFLDIGELEQAKALFSRLPESDRNSETGSALFGQITFLGLAAKTEGKAVLTERLSQNPGDADAAFDLAVCHVADFDYRQALELLFGILATSPDYKEGAARELIVNLINRLAPNEPEMAGEYRRRLSNTLAS